MNNIEFYKISIKEYPNHKNRGSLNFCINELQNEIDSIYRYIKYLECNEAGEEIIQEFIKDHDILVDILELARTY